MAKGKLKHCHGKVGLLTWKFVSNFFSLAVVLRFRLSLCSFTKRLPSKLTEICKAIMAPAEEFDSLENSKCKEHQNYVWPASCCSFFPRTRNDKLERHNGFPRFQKIFIFIISFLEFSLEELSELSIRLSFGLLSWKPENFYELKRSSSQASSLKSSFCHIYILKTNSGNSRKAISWNFVAFKNLFKAQCSETPQIQGDSHRRVIRCDSPLWVTLIPPTQH